MKLKKLQRGESDMGFFGWLIIALVVCGCFGVGPCADECSNNKECKKEIKLTQ